MKNSASSRGDERRQSADWSGSSVDLEQSRFSLRVKPARMLAEGLEGARAWLVPLRWPFLVEFSKVCRCFPPHLAVTSWFNVGRWLGQVDVAQTYTLLWLATWPKAADEPTPLKCAKYVRRGSIVCLERLWMRDKVRVAWTVVRCPVLASFPGTIMPLHNVALKTPIESEEAGSLSADWCSWENTRRGIHGSTSEHRVGLCAVVSVTHEHLGATASDLGSVGECVN